MGTSSSTLNLTLSDHEPSSQGCELYNASYLVKGAEFNYCEKSNSKPHIESPGHYQMLSWATLKINFKATHIPSPYILEVVELGHM